MIKRCRFTCDSRCDSGHDSKGLNPLLNRQKGWIVESPLKEINFWTTIHWTLIHGVQGFTKFIAVNQNRGGQSRPSDSPEIQAHESHFELRVNRPSRVTLGLIAIKMPPARLTGVHVLHIIKTHKINSTDESKLEKLQVFFLYTLTCLFDRSTTPSPCFPVLCFPTVLSCCDLIRLTNQKV